MADNVDASTSDWLGLAKVVANAYVEKSAGDQSVELAKVAASSPRPLSMTQPLNAGANSGLTSASGSGISNQLGYNQPINMTVVWIALVAVLGFVAIKAIA